MRDDLIQGSVKRGKAIAQKQAQVDTLGAVVELALVNRQAGCFGKGFRQALVVEEMIQVMTDAFAQCLKRRRMASESMNLRQRFHYETRVEMINKVTDSIDCVIPGAVRILCFQDEIEVLLRRFPIVVIGKDLGSAGQQKRAVRSGVNHSPAIVRSIGATAGLSRSPEVLDVFERMTRDGSHDFSAIIGGVGR